MKKVRRERPYRGIGRKLISVLVVSVVLSLTLFCVYFFFSMRSSSIEKFVQQTDSAVAVSVQNIDYYIDNCISSARSIYADHEVVSLLSQSDGQSLSVDETDQIYRYLQTVHYAASGSEQVFLASMVRNTSFLYLAKYMQTSAAELTLSHEDLPSFSSWDSIYIQPTHTMGNYGHVIRFDAPIKPPEEELVFTIWFPVYNLPQGDRVIALVAIDFPIDFLNQNCQMVYEEDEHMYIVDDEGNILAASDPTVLFGNLSNVCPGAIEMGDEEHRVTDGQLILQRRMESDYLNWKIVKTVPLSKIYSTNFIQLFVLLALFLCGLGVVVVINTMQVLRYTRPLRKLTDYMHASVKDQRWREVQPLSQCVDYPENDELGMLMDSFESMLSTIQDYILQKYELELAYTRSTLKMLQAQINPHFIYNTLQCFATNALKRQDLDQYRLLSSFGQMLHYAMILEPAVVSLREEAQYVERYIALQQMRFKNKGEVQFSIEPEAEECGVPRMTLQPLVENSILHGNVLKKPGSILHITARISNGMLHLSVADNGRSVDLARVRQMRARSQRLRQVFAQDAARPEGPGVSLPELFSRDENGTASIGMENVLLRLFLNFGTGCSLDLCANSMGGTTVELELPFQTPNPPAKEANP
ncbi:sensor histidine kinase [uncultured Ruthenibacterium sp.]|uniref:sensor histidine kinase n=1 Tax=uncultured Ruthenibacterium sp. TaxID=1905347 RepID=UPI00349E5557